MSERRKTGKNKVIQFRGENIKFYRTVGEMENGREGAFEPGEWRAEVEVEKKWKMELAEKLFFYPDLIQKLRRRAWTGVNNMLILWPSGVARQPVILMRRYQPDTTLWLAVKAFPDRTGSIPKAVTRDSLDVPPRWPPPRLLLIPKCHSRALPRVRSTSDLFPPVNSARNGSEIQLKECVYIMFI